MSQTLLQIRGAFGQVATAKIRLQLLAISHSNSVPGSSPECDYESANGGSWINKGAAEESEDSRGTEASTANATGSSTDIGTEKTSLQCPAQLIPGPGSQGVGGDGSGDGGNEKKRTRKEPPTSESGLSLFRFACPYQVFEPWQGCLKRGRRNPRGGCNGINRLK
jgi:hypothetical protein